MFDDSTPLPKYGKLFGILPTIKGKTLIIKNVTAMDFDPKVVADLRSIYEGPSRGLRTPNCRCEWIPVGPFQIKTGTGEILNAVDFLHIARSRQASRKYLPVMLLAMVVSVFVMSWR